MMGDLIWVGNTLIPRGVVFLTVIIALLIIAGALAWIISLLTRPHGGGK